MSLSRSSWLPIAIVIACGLATSCRRQAPWFAPDWRPAEPPRRIVAASLLSAEVLLAIAPRERLVGVHTLAADPTFSLVAVEAKQLPLVGAEAEQLLELRPDLVFCDPFTRPETLALVSTANIPVVVARDAHGFDDVRANVRRIGQVCHLEAAAEQLVNDMDRRLAALRERAPQVAEWRLISLDGALHSHGRDSLFAAVVAAAGARNLAAERGVGPYRKLDVETVLGWQPDAIVLGDDGDPAVVPAWMAQQPGLRLLRCVTEQRLVRLPGPLLATTSHRLVETAEFVQRQLLQWRRP